MSNRRIQRRRVSAGRCRNQKQYIRFFGSAKRPGIRVSVAADSREEVDRTLAWLTCDQSERVDG